MKVLISTSNQAKLHDIQSVLSNTDFELLTLQDVDVKGDPVEDQPTFEKNAIKKARFYAELTNLPTIADDGGLMIDVLGGEPGVYSRRWPGYEATDEELIKYALEKLKDFPKERRIAQLRTCVCFYNPINKDLFTQEEGIKGWIAFEPSQRETNGYPFRALFKLEGSDIYYDENSPEIVKKNHRRIAVQKLLPKIKSSLIL